MQPSRSIITPHDIELLAYALFTLAAQLKVYPFLFALMLIDRWRALRENLAASHHARGSEHRAPIRPWAVHLRRVRQRNDLEKLQASGPLQFHRTCRITRSSLGSCCGHGRPQKSRCLWPMQHVVTIQVGAALPVVLACLGVILATVYRANRKGDRCPPSAWECALRACSCPGVSHDYTLPVLTGPFAALLLKYEHVIDRADTRYRRLLAPILMCSAAYACLLFSPSYRPLFLGHNTPILMAMVIGVTWLSLAAKNLTADARSE